MKKIQLNKIIIGLLLSLFLGTSIVHAQQDPQYSQYMFNPLAYNPAYAGSQGALRGTILLRRQWLGISGGPATATIAVHSPSSNERHGFGLNFVYDKLGVTTQNFLNLSYAYRVPVGSGFLSLGLQGGLTSYAVQYSQINPRDPDPSKPDLNISAMLPRAGTGLYFQNEKVFLGFSVPNLLAGRYFQYKKNLTQELAASQRMHYFLTAGTVLSLSKNVKFRPTAIMKMVNGSPLQFDLNLTAFFYETLGLGVGYRTGDALVFMLEYRSPRSFRAGYAYDYSLSEIRTVSSGSHELMIGVDLNWGRSKFLSPRFF